MLNVRPAPLRHEDFGAYLLRVSAENGYASPQVLLSAIDIENAGRDSLAWSDATLGALADLIGRPVAELAAVASRPLSRNKVQAFGGQPVPREALERRSLAFCPRCLAEGGFYHRGWRLKLATGCAVHGRALVDRCARCGTALTWRRAELFACACGFDLRSASAPELPATLDQLNAHLTALIENSSGAAGPPPAALAGLSLGDTLPVLELVHRIRMSPSTGGTHRALTSMSRSARLEAIAGVAAVLVDWPDRFWDLLDQLGPAADKGGGVCVKTDFGAIYGPLYAPVNRDRYRSLRLEFERFIEARFGARVSRRGRPLAARAVKREDAVTLAAAAASTGLSREVLRRQIHQGQLRAQRVQSGRSHAWRIPIGELARRDILTRVERAAARARTKKAAARQLGICPAALEGLIRTGLVDLNSDRPAAELLTRCEAMDRAAEEPPPADLVPFRIAMAGTLRKRRITLAEVVREVTSGRRAVWIDREKGGLDRLGFSRRDLAAWCADLPDEVSK